MEFFHQLYFVLYKHFYNRTKYINTKIKFSPEGNASYAVAACFYGWILLIYFALLKIFNFQRLDKKYGAAIVILAAVVAGGLVANYFNRNSKYLVIYKQYQDKPINKSRLILVAITIFILPFLLLILLGII
jgi:hypothetical protein